jgi:hypothetical protein
MMREGPTILRPYYSAGAVEVNAVERKWVGRRIRLINPFGRFPYNFMAASLPVSLISYSRSVHHSWQALPTNGEAEG